VLAIRPFYCSIGANNLVTCGKTQPPQAHTTVIWPYLLLVQQLQPASVAQAEAQLVKLACSPACGSVTGLLCQNLTVLAGPNQMHCH
jgi:hypothetical protein